MCGYCGVMHNLHCRKLLCRRCRGASCMHLQFRILLVCWCSHNMRWNSGKLRGLWCWELLCGRRRRASGMPLHRGICLHINNIERMHNNDRDLRDVHGGE